MWFWLSRMLFCEQVWILFWFWVMMFVVDGGVLFLILNIWCLLGLSNWMLLLKLVCMLVLLYMMILFLQLIGLFVGLCLGNSVVIVLCLCRQLFWCILLILLYLWLLVLSLVKYIWWVKICCCLVGRLVKNVWVCFVLLVKLKCLFNYLVNLFL